MLVRVGRRRIEHQARHRPDVVRRRRTSNCRGVTLDTSEGQFTLDGKITRTLDQPTLDLIFKGTADIARASQWAPPPIHVAGHAAVDATMKGAPTAFVLDAHVSHSDDAEVGHGAWRAHRCGVAADAEPHRGRAIDDRAGDRRRGARDRRCAVRRASGVVGAGGLARARCRLGVPDGRGARAAVRRRARPAPRASTALRASRSGSKCTTRPRRATRAARRRSQGNVEFFIEKDRWRAAQSHRLGALERRPDGLAASGIDRRPADRRSKATSRSRPTDIGQSTRYAALFGLPSPSIVTQRDRAARRHRDDGRHFHRAALRRHGDQRRRGRAVGRPRRVHRGLRRVAAASSR